MQLIQICELVLFIYLGFYVAFNTVQVISWPVVGRAEETSTYSSSGFGTVNCRPTVSNHQLSHLRPCQEPNPGLRDGRRECYHSATVAPSANSSRHTYICIYYCHGVNVCLQYIVICYNYSQISVYIVTTLKKTRRKATLIYRRK